MNKYTSLELVLLYKNLVMLIRGCRSEKLGLYSSDVMISWWQTLGLQACASGPERLKGLCVYVCVRVVGAGLHNHQALYNSSHC